MKSFFASVIAPVATIFFPTHTHAQDLGIKAPPQSAPVAIVNAHIHTITGSVIDGAILFDKGVITDLVPGKVDPPAGTTIVDAQGKHVYPGLIGAYTQLGLDEISSLRPSKDINESGGVTPEALAVTAVNPDSWMYPVTRTNGVLLAGVFPQGGQLPGRAGVIRFDGWTSEDMAVKRESGLVVEWPLMRIVRSRFIETPDDEQQKNIRASLETIRNAFRDAAAYAARKDADPTHPTDLRWEAMRRVFPQKDVPQSPVFVQANDYDQIVAAVELKRTHKLDLVLIGGLDAPLCADLLKREGVAVIVTTMITIPRRDDHAYDANYTLPKKLLEAGIKFCIASGEEVPHERNLPYAAAMAAAHGLPIDDAVKSVTLWPAEILGVSSSYGSLEKGKSATLIVTTDNPLEVGAQTTHAFIDGRAIDLNNKQSDLARKYREKYKQRTR